jgi:hypothetical protein
MIELINEDYADFVNLSTNLVGLDKCILRLKEPLLNHQAGLSLHTDKILPLVFPIRLLVFVFGVLFECFFFAIF